MTDLDRRDFFRDLVKILGTAATAIPSAIAVGQSGYLSGMESSAAQKALFGQPQSMYLLTRVSQARTHLFMEEVKYFISRAGRDSVDEIIVIDSSQQPEAFASMMETFGPNTKDVPELLLFKVGDQREQCHPYWDQHWIQFVEEKFAARGCYPVSGSWWSVEGDFQPTLKKVQTHLLKSPNHTGGHFGEDYILSLRFGEAQSLHSDHHREMIHEGQVFWDYVNKACPADN